MNKARIPLDLKSFQKLTRRNAIANAKFFSSSRLVYTDANNYFLGCCLVNGDKILEVQTVENFSMYKKGESGDELYVSIIKGYIYRQLMGEVEKLKKVRQVSMLIYWVVKVEGRYICRLLT